MSEDWGKLLGLLIIPQGHKGENSIELLATLTHSLTNFHKIEKRDEKKDTADKVTVTIRKQQREKENISFQHSQTKLKFRNNGKLPC